MVNAKAQPTFTMSDVEDLEAAARMLEANRLVDYPDRLRRLAERIRQLLPDAAS
jgi:hypothetical protein